MDRVALAKAEKPVQFFSSGSTLLDLALGGGWALSRVFNIVGDKSTGKTLLAIEAFANFKRKFPEGRMYYAEAESAFDTAFAQDLGFPEEVERPEQLIHTVEEFKVDLMNYARKGGPALYILDSLDALSSDAEVGRLEDELKGKDPKGSYNMEKPKALSEMFRNLVQDMDAYNCSLGVISQIRDKIGVMFGETKTRSGGHALDFYASQVVWLAEIGKKERQVMNEKRTVGVSIQSRVKKNKVGLPYREAYYDLMFGYGVDDEMSMIDWMKDIKAINEKSYKDLKDKIVAARETGERSTVNEIKANLVKDCTNLWNEIEKQLKPPMKKYGD